MLKRSAYTENGFHQDLYFLGLHQLEGSQGEGVLLLGLRGLDVSLQQRQTLLNLQKSSYLTFNNFNDENKNRTLNNFPWNLNVRCYGDEDDETFAKFN